ncbi:MAG: 2,3-butanediol dehydrogenase [Corynebacterium sp.]|nr:2,3-butanediol dehydrogenase [Corynebacterium sp.]
MRAARFYDREDIRIEEVDPQPLTSDSVRIDVAWCGICGTDLHEYLDGPIFCPEHGHPHPISGEDAPVTLGHEFSGVIAEVGPEVTGLEVGDHVVVEPYIVADDVDTSEDSKTYHLSENMNFVGLAGRGGGLSENIVVGQRWVHKISKDIPLDQAALIEPLAVAYHAVERAGVLELSEAERAKLTALIGGAGPIGVLTGAVLKALGVRVIISELSELRRQKALDSAAADVALNPAEQDVVEEVLKLTDGRGADVSFECTSVEVVLNTLLKAMAPRGIVVNVSIWGKQPVVDLHTVVMKELDLRGTIGYVNNHPDTIKLVESGKINLKPFITGKIGLEHIVDEGFDTLIHRNETAVKILVSPSGKGLE